MKKLAMLALAIVSLFVGTAAKAAKPVTELARQGNWQIDYDQDSCHLLAKFGAGRDEIIVELTRFGHGTSFDLALTGTMFRSSYVTMPIAVGFDPIFPVSKREAMAAHSAKGIPMALFQGLRLDNWVYAEGLSPPAITPEQEAKVAAIEISQRGKVYRLATGSLGKPMSAMRTCLDDLVRHWGYDSAVQASLSRTATPLSPPSDWLRQSAFPATAARTGENGLVQFRLDVDATGQIGNCRVLFRTDPDEFADRTCKLIKLRARFSPALDAQGKPVRSYYLGRARWIAWWD